MQRGLFCLQEKQNAELMPGILKFGIATFPI